MVVKSQDQITLVDLTDGYSAMLSTDSISLSADETSLGTDRTITINVEAFHGSSRITPDIDENDIICPNGVTASVGTASYNILPVTFVFSSSISSDGIIIIPILLDDAITISKTLTFSLSYKGSSGEIGPVGPMGPEGEDAIVITISSNNGTIFKNNSENTTLYAHVFKGGVELSSEDIMDIGSFQWYKDNVAISGQTNATLIVQANAINDKAVYEIRLES